MDLEHVGVESKLFGPHQLLQVDIYCQVEPSLIDGAPLDTSRNVAQCFADIGRGKLDPVFLQRIWQQSEGLFLDRAFARVGIRRLVVVGLLVLLGDCGAAPSGHDNQGQKPRPHPATAKTEYQPHFCNFGVGTLL